MGEPEAAEGTPTQSHRRAAALDVLVIPLPPAVTSVVLTVSTPKASPQLAPP